MFFKVLRSVISFDGSINRITSNPGGKNVNIIFAYLTSLAYDQMMHTPADNGRKGIDILQAQEWTTPKVWLEKMQWGGANGSNSHTIFMVSQLFKSFQQDGVFEVRGEEGLEEYKFIQPLEYPTDEQIEQARASNKYLMMAIDDLLALLPKTLATGQPQASRNKSSYLPLWEALLSDPLTDIFREEMVFQVKNNYPKLDKEQTTFKILEIATGTGSATIRLIRDLIEEYENTEITIYCYEEIASQLNRAKERIASFDNKVKSMYLAKGLSFKYEYKVKRFKDPIKLPTAGVDMIVAFQNLPFIKPGDRYSYFENLARMLADHGSIIMAQTTSYSKDFPHPLSLAYLAVEGFEGYPTVEEMNEVCKSFFKKIQSSGIDSIWVVSKPKFEYD